MLPEEPTGDRTALAAVLAGWCGPDPPPSRVLLISDGSQRDLPPSDLPPSAAAATAGGGGHPGDRGAAGLRRRGCRPGLDLSVEDLRVDPVVFEKKRVPVSGVVRIDGGAGREFSVRLLTESPPARGPGDEVELVPVQPTDGSRPAVIVRPTEGSGGRSRWNSPSSPRPPAR